SLLSKLGIGLYGSGANQFDCQRQAQVRGLHHDGRHPQSIDQRHIGVQAMSGKVQRQRGAALLVSLVLLLIMTVLAISSMQGTVLQEGMVSAQRDAQIAIEGAE